MTLASTIRFTLIQSTLRHSKSTLKNFINVTPIRFLANQTSQEKIIKVYTNDPLQHGTQHLNKFYNISETDMKKLDPLQECLSRDAYAEFKSFNENCLMIRKPAIEIINYLKNVDLSLPAYRFILYGTQEGTGKRSTLLHLMHYCINDNWIVINLPNCSNVLRSAKETQPSFYKEGRVDTPIHASLFLKRLSILNMKLLKSLDLKTTKEYKWSNRDSSPIGTPLLQLIEYANDRIKYASDICGVIIKEIKLQSSQKNFKVFVAADQVNCFFGPSRLRRPDKSEVLTDDLTIVRNFKKLFKNDWTNAVIVGSIGKLGVIIPAPNRRTKFYDSTIPIALRRRVECNLHYEGPLTPAHLLKREGFYYLEPFVPIEVPSYSDEEITNHFEYYKERNWIQNPEARTSQGQEEIIFLSGKNPTEFARVCQNL